MYVDIVISKKFNLNKCFILFYFIFYFFVKKTSMTRQTNSCKENVNDETNELL